MSQQEQEPMRVVNIWLWIIAAWLGLGIAVGLAQRWSDIEWLTLAVSMIALVIMLATNVVAVEIAALRRLIERLYGDT